MGHNLTINDNNKNVTLLVFKANYFIMNPMKRFILMFTAIMFFANTFIVSAWAKPCVGMMDAPQTAEKVMMVDGKPCHDDKQKEKTPTKHCDGVCLCFHVSVNQTPILDSSSEVKMLVQSADRHAIKNERMSSYATAPPSPPPKSTS